MQKKKKTNKEQKTTRAKKPSKWKQNKKIITHPHASDFKPACRMWLLHLHAQLLWSPETFYISFLFFKISFVCMFVLFLIKLVRNMRKVNNEKRGFGLWDYHSPDTSNPTRPAGLSGRREKRAGIRVTGPARTQDSWSSQRKMNWMKWDSSQLCILKLYTVGPSVLSSQHPGLSGLMEIWVQ